MDVKQYLMELDTKRLIEALIELQGENEVLRQRVSLLEQSDYFDSKMLEQLMPDFKKIVAMLRWDGEKMDGMENYLASIRKKENEGYGKRKDNKYT